MNTILRLITRHLASLASIFAALFGMAQPSSAEEETPAIIYTFGREHCEDCRNYRLQLFASGQVLFVGTVQYYELPPSASKTTKREIRRTTLSPQKVASWTNELNDQGFFSLLPRYRGDDCAADGRSEQSLTIYANHTPKSVSWVGCPESQVPSWLSWVATDIRKQVNPEQWLEMIPNPYRR